jgi:NAD(P)-dependent dehydrogenase (short-subunit alcohol dehydrogenase family)
VGSRQVLERRQGVSGFEPHDAGGGSLIVTGNTSTLRGKASFAGFAPTKAAQRILAESIARQMGPKGVHVAYLMIDAVIDVPWTRERMKDAPDDFFIQPDAIAEEAWHIAISRSRPGPSSSRSGRSARIGELTGSAGVS